MNQLLAGLRPYRPADIDAIASLLRAARAVPPDPPPAAADLISRWQRRHVDPAHAVSLLPGPGGELIGYALTAVPADGVPRVTFEIAIDPAWRRRGLGAALFRLAEDVAARNGIEHMTAPLFVAPGAEPAEGASFLVDRGFRVERRFWQMRIDGLDVLTRPEWPSGIGWRTVDPGRLTDDARQWAELIRLAFNEPADAQGVLAQMHEPGSSIAGYFFAIEEATGILVGTSRARIDVLGGRPIGYVGTVGVLPEYRGRGIARALVSQTLAYLAGQGMDSSVLFVEDGNHVARRLYEKMGWHLVYRTDHYWRRQKVAAHV